MKSTGLAEVKFTDALALMCGFSPIIFRFSVVRKVPGVSSIYSPMCDSVAEISMEIGTPLLTVVPDISTHKRLGSIIG